MSSVERPNPALLDRRAVKDGLAAALEEARGRTLELLAPLDHEALVRQHSPLMSPLVWDLAHIGFFEELWLVRRVGDEAPILDRDEVYDAFLHARADRPGLPLLEPAEARDYLACVRERSLAILDRTDLDPDDRLLRDGYVYGLVVQHEQQHVETMLATLNLRDGEYPFAEPPAPAPGPVRQGEVSVEGGPFPMGTDDQAWAYDNERAEHELDLPPFLIDTTPVTNGAFLAFVEAGGYDDERIWAEGGWAWRNECGAGHPDFWRREGDGSWSRRRLGRWEQLPLDEPVQHVCWYEADAFARWAGRRLPTEAEWEKAAGGEAPGGKRRYPWGDDLPDAGQANLAQRFGPVPAGSCPDGASPCGALQMIGDVWEWTASDFRPYPGFEPFPYAEYSEVFFGEEYKVLRGGSWATHPLAVRTTFRNWDFPVRRQIFAGFRCARDA
ncbi:MAG: ergothioneine biosynthesis protein EgtB [Gaiellaceae bacterium]